MFDIPCTMPWMEANWTGEEKEENAQLEMEGRYWPGCDWGCSDVQPPGPSNQSNHYAPDFYAQWEARSPDLGAHEQYQASHLTPDANHRITLTEDSMELCEQAPVLSSAHASDWGFSNAERAQEADQRSFQAMHMTNGLPYGAIGPPPLGLKLNKSTSFIDLITGELNHAYAQVREGAMTPKAPFLTSQMEAGGKDACCGEGETCSQHACGRVKASNFPATSINIGSWTYASKNEGDVVAKFYYAKKKLVWEVLVDGLKYKIEFHWNDIVDMEMTELEGGVGKIDILLSKAPTFSQESDPQPRKHTLWRACKDFTGNQASVCKQHVVYFEGGILKKHKAKLMECDPRLKSILETAGSRPLTETGSELRSTGGCCTHSEAERKAGPCAGHKENTVARSKEEILRRGVCAAAVAANTAGEHPLNQPNQNYSCKKKKKNPSYTALKTEPFPVTASCMSFDSTESQPEETGQEVDAPHPPCA